MIVRKYHVGNVRARESDSEVILSQHEKSTAADLVAGSLGAEG
jgi:hypothetical protein